MAATVQQVVTGQHFQFSLLVLSLEGGRNSSDGERSTKSLSCLDRKRIFTIDPCSWGRDPNGVSKASLWAHNNLQE